MTIHRRSFLQSLGAAGAALAAGRTVAAEKPDASLPILDTHQHLWDLNVVHMPWLKGSDLFERSFVTKDYLAAVEGLNVVKAVYMEVDCAPAQFEAEIEYVVGLCRRGDVPTRAAVIGGRPGDTGFRKYITRFQGSPYVKGVREILRLPESKKTLAIGKSFLEGIRLLGKLNMCFDLCIPADTIEDAATRLVDACPDTRFVLDHCGNADPKVFQPGRKWPDARSRPHDIDGWRRGIDAMAKRKNVVCKISGIVAAMPRGAWAAADLAPVVNHCLDAFGPQRVMFASDWPVCLRGAELRQWVAALREIIKGRPVADQRRLFHDNAAAFYGV